jgi:hypothetical protein
MQPFGFPNFSAKKFLNTVGYHLPGNQQYKLSGKMWLIKQLNAAIRRANCDKNWKEIYWINNFLKARLSPLKASKSTT